MDWMRKRGVTRLSANGVRLELGAEPPPPPEPEKALSEGEAVREGQKIAARKKRDDDAWDFLASEGAPGDWEPEFLPIGPMPEESH